MICVSEESADAVWLQARARFLAGSGVEVFVGRTGSTKELRTALLEIRNPRSRWVLSRAPLNPAAVLSEVVWILNGRNDSAFVNFFNNTLKDFAGEGPTYHGAYGHRLRNSFGLDQLSAAADALTSVPESRQVCLSIWDPRLDMPNGDGTPRSPDIPCNVVSMLKVRDGRLQWTQIMRSNDFWLGLPFNVVQFTMLQEILAGWLGLEVGSYHHLSDSLHLYEQHEGLLEATIPVESMPDNSDDLALTGRVQSEQLLRDMAGRIDELVASEATRASEEQLGPDSGWPAAYANWYRVMWSEAVRRRGFTDLSDRILGECTNPVLVAVQQRWVARLRSAS